MRQASFGTCVRQGESDGDGGAKTGSGADRGRVPPMLTGDIADQEEAEAGAFDSDHSASGDAVEAIEDALELVGG